MAISLAAVGCDTTAVSRLTRSRRSSSLACVRRCCKHSTVSAMSPAFSAKFARRMSDSSLSLSTAKVCSTAKAGRNPPNWARHRRARPSNSAETSFSGVTAKRCARMLDASSKPPRSISKVCKESSNVVSAGVRSSSCRKMDSARGLPSGLRASSAARSLPTAKQSIVPCPAPCCSRPSRSTTPHN